MLFRKLPEKVRPAAATVEFAILSLLLAFLFVIGIDYGRVYSPYLTVTNCARSGALYGSQDAAHAADTAGIQAAALADAGDLSPAPNVVSSTTTDASGTTYLDVTVTWTFYTVTNFPGLPSSLNLTRTVRMRVAPPTPAGS